MIWLVEILKIFKKRTVAEKVLKDKAFNIAKDIRYDRYQRGLASMVYKFFDKKTAGSGLSYTNDSTPQNEQLVEELHKPIIKKKKIYFSLFKKRRVHSVFKDYIWGADLADMQLIRKYNKGV